MTIKALKEIILTLPDDTPVIISAEKFYDVETAIVEYHSGGKTHLILSNDE